MIHIAIGTKAQFIKMAPIMMTLQAKGIDFNLIDLGQHAMITQNLREELELKRPDVTLSSGANIAHLGEGIRWAVRLLLRGLKRNDLKKNVFLNQAGVCLIHGDTISTLIALCLAKRAGLSVALVEAGLRSFSFFEPFPEELVRLLAMRFSDILFAPSSWAQGNLKSMGYSEKTVRLSSNTSKEAVFLSLEKDVDFELELKTFVLVTIHRLENIFSRNRLEWVLKLIELISRDKPVIFVQHHPTINQIAKFGLKERLSCLKNVKLFPVLSHAHFIHLLDRCEFVVTDGGSIQEESYFLGKPCLLLRKETERMEGIGENVVLSEYKMEIAEIFIKEYHLLPHSRERFTGVRPSIEIIDYLISVYSNH